VWGRTAENVAKFCSKGKEIYVEGKIQTRKYTDKSGVDRYSTEIVADNIRFLGSRADNSSVVQAQNTAFNQNDEQIPF
jgi:single-strand DNA-binding protein